MFDIMESYRMQKTENELFCLLIIIDRLSKKLIERKIITEEELNEMIKVDGEDIERCKNYEREILDDELERRKLI